MPQFNDLPEWLPGMQKRIVYDDDFESGAFWLESFVGWWF